MTYTSIVFRILLFAVPSIAVVALAVLLNHVDAGAGAGFLGLCLISVANGIGIALYMSRQDRSSRRGRTAMGGRRSARARH